MTVGASRQGVQPCLVLSMPGRTAKRIMAAKGALACRNPEARCLKPAAKGRPGRFILFT
jgi:hypothetical protein